MPAPEWPRMNCKNNPTGHFVPNWPVCPVTTIPVKNEPPPRHQLTCIAHAAATGFLDASSDLIEQCGGPTCTGNRSSWLAIGGSPRHIGRCVWWRACRVAAALPASREKQHVI